MDPQSTPPPGGLDLLLSLGGVTISAFIGKSMQFADDLLLGRPLSWRRLLLEVPSLIGVSIMASALAEWLHASLAVACGMAALGGWLGPKLVIDVLLRRLLIARKPSHAEKS